MKGFRAFHPFLFAMYAVVGVYTTNTNEVPIAELYRPLIVTFLAAALLLAAASWFFKDMERAGFVTTLVVFWVLYFGHVDLFSALSPAYRQIPAYRLITVAVWTALMLLLGNPWAWQRIRSPRLLTTALNVTSFVVILVPTVTALQIVNQTSGEAELIRSWQEKALIPETRATADPPDIYYIMVDGYSRSDMLMKDYGFDNSGFIQFLKARGFYVAEQSSSNYAQTELSMPSLLNLEYINFLGEDMGDSRNRRPLIELIVHSQVRRTVERAGYTFIALPSAFLFTQIRDADIYFSYTDSQVSDFEALLLSKSIFGPIIELAGLDIPLVNYETERKSILYTLDKLEELPDLPGPKFVFAHILSPHHPFVFDANGDPLGKAQPYYMAGLPDYYGSPREYSADLANELTFLDRRLEEVVTSILQNSKRPPLIIIHGDHGVGAALNVLSLQQNCLADRFAILNAYYFPDGDYSELYPTITLVNSFRVVFNAYFGTDLDLLDDENYYSTPANPYRFIRVTGHIEQNTCQPLNQR